MATAAARTRADRRELEPDWRDRLGGAVRTLVVKLAGVLAIAAALALAVSLLTHERTDPSWSTAAGGPAQNWLGLPGAYASDLLLLLFGPGGVTLLPVLVLAGVRLLGGRPTGRVGRALLVAAIGAVLIGIALGLTTKSVASGLPAGLAGVLGLAGASGMASAARAHPRAGDRGPDPDRADPAARARRVDPRLPGARPQRG